MKQTIKKITLATLVVGLIMVSCTKKSNSPTPTPTPTPTETKTQLLTGKNWKLTAQTYDPGVDFGFSGTLITDYYEYLMADEGECSLDDIYNFNTNGTYTRSDGATICDQDDPYTETLDWSFQNSETTLIKDGKEYTIVTLNSTTLKLKNYSDLDSYPDNETEVNYTYTKQ